MSNLHTLEVVGRSRHNIKSVKEYASSKSAKPALDQRFVFAGLGMT